VGILGSSGIYFFIINGIINFIVESTITSLVSTTSCICIIFEKFNFVMNRSWQTKKLTSKMICENETLVALDDKLNADKKVLCHKLCGAGNGGYFLVFSEKGSKLDFDYEMMKPIGISETGLKYSNLKNEFTKL
jgi:hypothetical protein